MKSAITKKQVSLFKKFTVVSAMALALVGCAIDEQYTFESSYQGATETKEVVVYSEFTGVFTQDEAETNTERRIQFSTEEAIEANKEYVVTIDGDEFKYTTTASTDHQSLAYELSQAIDGDSKYTATAENNVIKIQAGAGTSSISATKAGALKEISEDPPTEALTVENPSEVDVGIYEASEMSVWDIPDYSKAIENFYSVEQKMTTKRISNSFDGSDPNSALLIVVLPQSISELETESMRKHLESGGRILFIAENNGCCSLSNNIVSTTIGNLGGSITVNNGSYYQGSNPPGQNNLNRSEPKNLFNSPLNSGVNNFPLDNYAELTIDPAISQAVMIDNWDRIVVADQALFNGRITLIADINFIGAPGSFLPENSDAKIFLSNLAIDSHNNQKKVQEGINPNENFAPTTGSVETIYSSIVNFDIVGQTLTIKSSNEKIGKEIQFESQSNGESNVEFKDEKLFVTYNKGVSTTEEIVALLNAYPEFSATTTGNIIIP